MNNFALVLKEGAKYAQEVAPPKGSIKLFITEQGIRIEAWRPDADGVRLLEKVRIVDWEELGSGGVPVFKAAIDLTVEPLSQVGS